MTSSTHVSMTTTTKVNDSYHFFKKDLDELYEKRRQVVAEFKRAEQEFNDMKKESRRQYRDELNRKREEERRQQAEQYQKEL